MAIVCAVLGTVLALISKPETSKIILALMVSKVSRYVFSSLEIFFCALMRLCRSLLKEKMLSFVLLRRL